MPFFPLRDLAPFLPAFLPLRDFPALPVLPRPFFPSAVLPRPFLPIAVLREPVLAFPRALEPLRVLTPRCFRPAVLPDLASVRLPFRALLRALEVPFRPTRDLLDRERAFLAFLPVNPFRAEVDFRDPDFWSRPFWDFLAVDLVPFLSADLVFFLGADLVFFLSADLVPFLREFLVPFLSAFLVPFRSAFLEPFLSAFLLPFLSALLEPFFRAPLAPFLRAPLAPALSAPLGPFLRADLAPFLRANLASDFPRAEAFLPALDFVRVRWREFFDLLAAEFLALR